MFHEIIGINVLLVTRNIIDILVRKVQKKSMNVCANQDSPIQEKLNVKSVIIVARPVYSHMIELNVHPVMCNIIIGNFYLKKALGFVIVKKVLLIKELHCAVIIHVILVVILLHVLLAIF